MSSLAVPVEAPGEESRWAPIVASAPTMAATMRAYLDQIAVSLRPRSVEAADNALRSFATYLVGERRLRRLKGVRRDHVEGYKLWLAGRPAGRGKTISARTVRHRLGMLRVFFERIIDWEWDDAPKSCPILSADLPPQLCRPAGPDAVRRRGPRSDGRAVRLGRGVVAPSTVPHREPGPEAPASGVGHSWAEIPTTGRLRGVAPTDPRNGASKANTPPSEATSQ